MAATIQTIEKPTRARGLDTSGNNNHAQIYSGRALEFDGVTDSLTVPDNVLEGKDWRTGTIVTWIYLEAAQASNDRIFSSYTSDTTRFYILLTNTSILRHQLGDENGYTDSNTALQLKTWYRIVITWNVDGTANIYINGVLDKASTGIDVSTLNAISMGGANVASIGAHNGSSAFFDGKMSDFQMWNSTWTADDVTYDYLNPEQLALNRGGTSLTNSNLKLWYPMNEGHRGNQSYVLDASNTGFNEAELLTNSSFDDGTTGWSLAVPAHGSVSASNGQLTLSVTDISGTSGQRNAYVRQTILEAGKRYRATVNIDSDPTGLHIKSEPMGGGVTYGIASSLGETTFDFTAANTGVVFRMYNIGSPSETGSIVVNSISIQGINNKHNATTVFYGDELLDNPTFTSDLSDWTLSGSLTPTYVGGNMQMNSDGSGFSTARQTFTTVIGRTYALSGNITVHGSSNEIEIGTSAGASDNLDYTTTGTGTITPQTFVATATTTHISVEDGGSGTGNTYSEVSVKEVGVATGWTDADQQLDIPQTALQSYNQLGWFDGVERLQSGSNITPGDHTSVSLWFFRNKGTSSEAMALIEAGNYADDNFYIFHKGDSINIMTFNEDDGTTVQTHAISTTVNNGQWYHLGVYIPAADGGTVKAYLNGQSIGTSTMSHPMKKTAYAWYVGYAGGLTYEYTEGGITEISYFNDQLTASEFEELYNNGLALNALEHSQTANLVHYWRNDGLTTWTDLKGSNNLTGSMTQSMLITAGADSSRDSQGFLMNRQRLTNTINGLYTGSSGGGTYNAGAVVQDSSTLDIIGAFTIGCWVKLKDFNYSYNLIEKKISWNSAGYGIYIHKSSKRPYLEWSNGSDVQQASGGTNDTDTLDVWYFVYGVHDPDGLHNSGTGIDRLYSAKTTDTSLNIDGKTSMHAGNIDDAVATNDLPLTIGNHYGGGQVSSASIHFTGEIDDVVIYNGALSPEQVLRNFKAGKRSHR